jgi:hypothetical protein
MQLEDGMNIDSFIKWVRSFVSQFLGKRKLELQCKNLPTGSSVKISILAVDRLQYQIPPWHSFEETIQSAIQNHIDLHLDSKATLQILRDQVLHYEPDSGEAAGIVRTFRELIKNGQSIKPQPYALGMHCEAVLAALAMGFDKVALKNDTHSICKVLRVSAACETSN